MQATDSTLPLQHWLLGDVGEHAEVPMVVFDEDRNFVVANDAYCEFTGYTRDELVKLRAGESLAGDDQTRNDFARVAAGSAASLAGRGRLRCKSGEIVDVAWLTIKATIVGLPCFVGMLWPLDEAPFAG
jgi:PAS domain S-box-containing protein